MKLPEKRLDEMETRFGEVERLLADPNVAANPNELKSLGKEHSELRPTIEAWRSYKQARSDLRRGQVDAFRRARATSAPTYSRR